MDIRWEKVKRVQGLVFGVISLEKRAKNDRKKNRNSIKCQDKDSSVLEKSITNYLYNFYNKNKLNLGLYKYVINSISIQNKVI